MSSFCGRCGGPLPGEAVFCPRCGRRVAAASRDEPVSAGGPEAVAAAGPAAARSLAPFGLVAAAVSKPGRPARIALGAAAAGLPLVVVIGLAAYHPLANDAAEILVDGICAALAWLLLIRFLDLYEREPLAVVGLLLAWGATAAIWIAVVFEKALDKIIPAHVNAVFGTALTAPPVEESAKGIALLIAFSISRWASRHFGSLEFEGVTDGIVYGAAVGVGFALAEDLIYFIRFYNCPAGSCTDAEALGHGLGVFVDRVGFFGLGTLGHPLYTAAFGAGLGAATWARSRRWRLLLPAVGFAAAVMMHATWNGFSDLVLVIRYGWKHTADFDSGVPIDARLATRMNHTADHAESIAHWLFYLALLAFAIGIALWLRHQRRILEVELAPEVSAGLITQEDFRRMLSWSSRPATYWAMLARGELEKWRVRRRIDNELADLAFLKWRARRGLANERDVLRRRERIEHLQRLLAVVV